MNKEKLEKSKKLNADIETLEKHIEAVKSIDGDRWIVNADSPLKLSYRNMNHYYDTIGLRGDLLNFEDFMLVYLSRAESKLKSLQSEFEAL